MDRKTITERAMSQSLLTLLLLSWSLLASAQEASAEIHRIDAQGVGARLGTVTISETAAGLAFQPDLAGLPPGPHGFHLHEGSGCAPGEKDGKAQAGLAAGGHYDPDKTGQHKGPEGAGHKGDLPMLNVAADGTAREAIVSKRLRLDEVRGRALIIHAEADNYADQPGGARMACGVIQTVSR